MQKYTNQNSGLNLNPGLALNLGVCKSESDRIHSDFGTKIFISDWIGFIKLFRSRIGLRYSKYLVKYFHLNDKFILLKDSSDRIGTLKSDQIRIRRYWIGF